MAASMANKIFFFSKKQQLDTLLLTTALQLVWDRISVSGTETKFEFQYRSRNLLSRNQNCITYMYWIFFLLFWLLSDGRLENMKLKIFFQNSLLFDLEFEFRYLILLKKIPHTPYVSVLLRLKLGGFGIGYGIGRPKVSAD